MTFDFARVYRFTSDTKYALGDNVLIHKVLLKNGTTTAVASLSVIDGAEVTASQDETDYDGAGSNGSFTGGTDYDVGDTITLNDGTVITVDAVDDDPTNGVVTEFTVTTAGTSGFKAGATLYQVSTTGATPTPSGFTLTPSTANYALATSVPAVEVITDEVTDGTAAEFARTKEVNFNPPLRLEKGASVDISGTNAVGYLYYSF